MAERIARVVREEPRRSFGFLIGVAALLAAAVVLAMGLSGTPGAAAGAAARIVPAPAPRR